MTARNDRRVVRFVPVTDGDIIDLPNTAIPGVGRRGFPTVGTYAVGAPGGGGTVYDKGAASNTGDHVVIGYQPAPFNPRARKPYEPAGWLIVLVDESVKAQPARLRRSARAVEPSSANRHRRSAA